MTDAWWQGFFDVEYTDLWAGAGMFDRTAEEVEGIQRVLPSRTGLRILDVPCGFGRHAGALHAAGHRVTGVDLSGDQLAIAAERHPGPAYLQGDMRTPPDGPFDVVLNLFSSFGYFDDDAQDAVALRAWHDVLAPGGLLVIETNHRDRIARIFDPEAEIPIGDTGAVEFGTMDWVTGRMHRTVRLPDGRERRFSVRLYTPTELVSLLRGAGFADVEVQGDWEGTPIDQGSRLIAVARI
jgi:SAM-dependent methyltransferase